MEITGLLIDTVSIQKYIFSSNRLKENIGGSYLVEQVFERYLKQALQEIFPQLDIALVEEWKKTPDTISIISNPECMVEPAYIGGGNALILFREKSKAKEFVKVWSRILLQVAPGLNSAVAIDNFDPDPDRNRKGFPNIIDRIFQKLHWNKNRFFPITETPKFGVTKDCPFSNLSAEICYPDSDSQTIWISSSSYARMRTADEAESALNREWLQHKEGSRWRFTNEIDQLGQKENQTDEEASGYIAVVHIDGNNMGQQFAKCPTIPKYRELSRFISERTRHTFWKMTESLESISLKDFEEEQIFVTKKKDHTIFPMRPIVIGGDDITFICHAKLAFFLTKTFLDRWANGDSEQNLSACAGIAIVKTKYPFYQAYQFAEDLCSEAKTCSRKVEGSSWISFYIHQSGITGNLATMRSLHTPFGKESATYFGPYLYHSHEKQHSLKDQNLTILEEGIQKFTLWPRTKLMGLRSALIQGKFAFQDFVEREKIHKNLIPDYCYTTTGYKQDGWCQREALSGEGTENATPYLDMIDLMDVYRCFHHGGDQE